MVSPKAVFVLRAMNESPDISLVEKYNQPVPRYTSYPTVPFWDSSIDTLRWQQELSRQFEKHHQQGISLYIHLPFCESLCTYCGCNKKITTNHQVEVEYLNALIREWSLYRAFMKEPPLIREIHLGGGTPTFFSPARLEFLVNHILNQCEVHPDAAFSIEGHPNNTTVDHLETLARLGFRRISYGVQDHDPEVQRIINRIQPFETVQAAIENARHYGYQSVNVDLIYGLPRQTLESMERTILQTLELAPDRIAFYSYAHVPWTSKGQRLFDENDLPDADLKMQLYQLGKKLFGQAGYEDVGMDHFALPTDELFMVKERGALHRNFMGYTTQATGLLLGLGVSSISDIGTAYAQNEKVLQHYYDRIDREELAVARGYFLTETDQHFRQYILDISCRGTTRFRQDDLELLRQFSFPELSLLAGDGLVQFDEQQVELTPLGHHFVRNVCRAFDLHLLANIEGQSRPVYSKAI